jgi:SAM-dependent methyltransferase
MRQRNDRETYAASFDRAAAVYDAARPSYPAEAVSWLTEGVTGPVLDLGAGTGKLTAEIVRLGFDVTALDPSERMLRVLAERLPGVEVRVGGAEQLPFSPGSFALVVAAQAWHWVDPDRAVPEVVRVLRPGGRLGLVWNDRDESVGWVRELGELMGSPDIGFGEDAEPRVPEPFGPLERHQVRWVQALTVEGLLDLVRSRSYFITKEPEAQAAVIASVRRLAAEHPDLTGRETLELPYVTRCYRTALA